jgi:hypothetical protein
MNRSPEALYMAAWQAHAAESPRPCWPVSPYWAGLEGMVDGLQRLHWPHYVRAVQRRMMAGVPTRRWYLLPSDEDLEPLPGWWDGEERTMELA